MWPDGEKEAKRNEGCRPGAKSRRKGALNPGAKQAEDARPSDTDQGHTSLPPLLPTEVPPHPEAPPLIQAPQAGFAGNPLQRIPGSLSKSQRKRHIL